MKIFKVIFKLIIAATLNGLIIFSTQASCPTITDIIVAFDKNGLPPKGWLLVSYTGKQIDKGFYFANATWNANSTYDKKSEGNVICEYTSANKANPGFLIIETTDTLPAPQGANWQHIENANKSTVCKGLGNINNCKF